MAGRAPGVGVGVKPGGSVGVGVGVQLTYGGSSRVAVVVSYGMEIWVCG